jgi:uncharacterized protein
LIYLDTSAIAPFYWTEPLSDAIETLLRNEPDVALSQLVEVELTSALSRRVRTSEINSETARAIADRFQTDLNRGFYTQLRIESTHYTMARDWINQFNTPLRTLDALHLAIASVHQIPMITADIGLAESSRRLGVEVRTLARL